MFFYLSDVFFFIRCHFNKNVLVYDKMENDSGYPERDTLWNFLIDKNKWYNFFLKELGKYCLFLDSIMMIVVVCHDLLNFGSIQIPNFFQTSFLDWMSEFGTIEKEKINGVDILTFKNNVNVTLFWTLVIYVHSFC